MSWLNIGHPSQKKTKIEKASIHISHNKLATDHHIDLTSPDLPDSGQASILAAGNFENYPVNPRGATPWRAKEAQRGKSCEGRFVQPAQDFSSRKMAGFCLRDSLHMNEFSSFEGKISKNPGCARTIKSDKGLHHRFFSVNPSILCCRHDHRIFA